ncbi:MAG: AAA family ATPase [Balneolaceae bacterium]|nr:MAG: AAA family ATPase [Balneolaceae bacterium]
MSYITKDITFGDRRLVGQKSARLQAERMLQSERLSHAYLLTGPDGVGKTAFALAIAEIVNGVDHLTDLKGAGVSKKSSWYTHPDIHVFLPLPSNLGTTELQVRLEMLSKDPYEIVDFSLRPALTDPDSSKNRRAFYSIEYYHKEIRPKTVYKPNEGRRVVVILTGIDTMRKESANAFLKLLEEPSDNILFILTASKTDQLLPTIISRCQHIRLSPLTDEEIKEGLVKHDGKSEEDASFLARLSDGNYSLTRFYDVEALQQTRKETIEFLRYSYTQDVPVLLKIIKEWNSSLNTENQIALCNTLEQLLRDIMVYRASRNEALIINIDQIEVIKKFCDSMENARLEDMIDHLQQLKRLLYQNVQFKYIFTALALRFAHLMRGLEPVISKEENWRHLPALFE